MNKTKTLFFTQIFAFNLLFLLLLVGNMISSVKGQNSNHFFKQTSDFNVHALDIQTDGKILIGGGFTKINGQTAFFLARLNSNGTLDAGFNAAVSGTVTKILVQSSGKILIGGQFTSVGGQTRQRVARLNSNGTLDTSFVDPQIGNTVNDLIEQSDGKLVVMGFFTSAGGQVRRMIARLNENGTLDTTYLNTLLNENADLGSFSPTSIDVQADGKILISNTFYSYTFNGQTYNKILRLNTDGTFDSSFNPNPNNTINKVKVLPDNKILVSGSFTAIGGQNIGKLAKLNLDGTTDVSFNTNETAFSVGQFLIQPDGKILAYGQPLWKRYNVNGDTDNSFINQNMNLYNFLNVQANGKILVKRAYFIGNSTQFYCVIRRINPDGSIDEKLPFDFDGDSKSDLSIFRPNVGEWWYLRSSDGGNRTFRFGTLTDKIVSADYTGDGKTDVAFWRPSTGEWFILRSEDNSFYAFPFGTNGDTPVPADYDGDGKADAAVFRSSNSTWFIQKSTGGTDIIGFGTSTDKPVAADYDSDGKADIAIFRPNGTNGAEWWIRRSSDGSVFATQFGTSTDKAVPGDFTGDGKTDIALWRPSNGNWFVLRSEDSSFFAFPFGANGDVPVADDYDGDGKTDAGVFRPSNNTWYIQRSTQGTLIQQFGQSGDFPIPNAYVP